MSSDRTNSYLGKKLRGLEDKHPGESGFYPLSWGVDALAARLVLAERAELSIDAQYYHVTNDIVSQCFFDALLRAADRGVLVRLLIDDVFTKGKDYGLAGLDSHPNFSIRVYNPFARRHARFIDGIMDFRRVTRRMHNKSFTIDGLITIIGGRNIADEYYGAGEDVNFGDLDVLAIGPVVDEISGMFEQFWNHKTATSLSLFAQMPDDTAAELARIRALLEASRAEIRDSRYSNAVRKRFLEYLDDNESLFTWSSYALVADSPGKSEAPQTVTIRKPLQETINGAGRELLIISPYFVPRKAGVLAFTKLKNRGVDITVVTNSLAANNQPSVHAGYAPSRKALLKSGVKLYEVSAEAHIPGAEFAVGNNPKAALHTKSFIVDRCEWFVGSFNFDPRSANINTEMGVIIRSPELAERAAESFLTALRGRSYEVVLNDKGKLEWRGIEGNKVVVHNKEPQTTWLQRFSAKLKQLLPIRGQL